MKRECTLNTYAVRDLTDCECFADAATFTLNDNAFEDLDTLTRSLYDFNVDTYCVTRTESRYVRFELFFCDFTEQFLCVHELFSFFFNVHIFICPSIQQRNIGNRWGLTHMLKHSIIWSIAQRFNEFFIRLRQVDLLEQFRPPSIRAFK